MFKLQSPSKYYQGAGLLNNIAEHLEPFKSVFIISGQSAFKNKKEVISNSLESHHIHYLFDLFNGEVTYKEVFRLVDYANSQPATFDCLIGIGGGKVIDVARFVAHKLKLPFIAIPTIASTDGPCSSGSVMYDEEGKVAGVEFFPTNPYMVLVDSQVIAEAPVHSLVAGMGDALATYFEARVCYENGYKNTLGTPSSETAIGMAKLCYDTLIKYGLRAKIAASKQVVNTALEKIIEANTYLSCVGFENGGLSCAHSIQDALNSLPECHDCPHGYRVAFGTLALLVLEERPIKEINEVFEFCYTVGLPITLKDIGLIEEVEAKVKKLSPLVFNNNPELPYRMPPGTTIEKIEAAILVTDELGKTYLLQKNSI